MKEKLLALILVLGMSSMTNATLSLVVGDGTTFTNPGDDFTIAIGDTIWIGINDSVGTMYVADITIWVSVSSVCEWTGYSAVYSPPAISTAPGWIYGSNESLEWWWVDLRDPLSDETPLPGVGCAVELRGLNAGKEWIFLNLGPVGYDEVFVLHIVPEPTTVILLALGSLALIRCRR